MHELSYKLTGRSWSAQDANIATTMYLDYAHNMVKKGGIVGVASARARLIAPEWVPFSGAILFFDGEL